MTDDYRSVPVAVHDIPAFRLACGFVIVLISIFIVRMYLNAERISCIYNFNDKRKIIPGINSEQFLMITPHFRQMHSVKGPSLDEAVSVLVCTDSPVLFAPYAFFDNRFKKDKLFHIIPHK